MKNLTLLFLFFVFTLGLWAQTTIRTNTSEDWDYWRISENISSLGVFEKAALVFVPVISAVILKKG